jgi:hypothetical protein
MTLSEGQLRLGRVFESEYERQAHARGYHVVRHCDQLGVTGTKAPILTGPYSGYRLPDFTILANGGSYWNEVKYKSRQAYYGIAGEHRHGIDLPNWKDYLTVCKLSGLPGFLIIGEGSTGHILIASFARLTATAQVHRCSSAFPFGMVFWNASDFQPWGEFDTRNGQMRFDFSKGVPR